MSDIIWGNATEILLSNSFRLNVTHKKNGNKQDFETIKIISDYLPGLPIAENDWNEESLKICINDAFVKCEITQMDESGIILAKVSHSGAGEY